MYHFTRQELDIKTNIHAECMRRMFREQQQDIVASAFDTETTGLNPVMDKPFLFQFGWLNLKEKRIYTFTVDLEQRPILAKQVIKVWQLLAKETPEYLGHHVVFDLHMVTNIGLPYDGENISDTMAYIRLGTDAVQERKGGAPLGLKEFCTKYISSDANADEQHLNKIKSAMTSTYNNQLKLALGWTKKQIDKFFKDTLNEVEDLPTEKQNAYIQWKSTLPLYLQEKVTGAVTSDMIRYDKLPRPIVTKYGHNDVYLTLELWYVLKQALEVRQNQEALQIERANIYPLYRMERVGFSVNKPYLMQAKQNTKEYIRTRRKDLYRLAGQQVSIGQHDLLKTILKNMGCEVASTGSEVLDRTVSELKRSQENPIALEFIETLQELRTLEKWYATYICRFLYDLRNTDRIYTSINAYGAVSGRVTCDFQQFPKKALETIDGVELFHPRRLVKVTEGYKGIIYLDYSQVELRLQAMYTILVGQPDTNLCRAYSPYQCFTYQNGEQVFYDYHNPTHIAHAYDWDWYYIEEPEKKWTPLDVHGATTKAAFDIDESDPQFHDLRYVGKRVNFAKNYGAQRGKIREMFPEFSEEQVDKIDGAYYKAFPGVKAYHNYCYAIAMQQPFAVNIFGTKYWGVSGHNLINILVQGSGAYLLKTKINQVDNYLRKHHCKSRLQMQIHDELSFEWHPDDPPELWFTIKSIMQDWEDTLIPIISDMEVTYTNWAEKQEVESVEQLKTTH